MPRKIRNGFRIVIGNRIEQFGDLEGDGSIPLKKSV
jgi:hypothetical protein